MADPFDLSAAPDADFQDPQKPASGALAAPSPSPVPTPTSVAPAVQEPQEPQGPQPVVPAVTQQMRRWIAQSRTAEARASIDQLTNDQVLSQLQRTSQTPDGWAESVKVARELGLNPEHLSDADTQKMAREVLTRREVEQRDLARRYPNTAKLLSRVKWAPVARDDLDNLTATDRSLSALGAAWERGLLQTDLGLLAAHAAADRISRDAEQPLRAVRDMSDLDPDLLFRYRRMKERLDALPESAGFFPAAAEVLAQQVRTLPVTAGAAGAGFLVGGPVGATVGGLAATIGTSGAIEGGSFYADMREKGASHEETIGPALVVAAVNGTLEAAGEVATVLPFGKIVAREIAHRAAGKLFKETVKGAAVEAVKDYALSIAGESSTEVLQEIHTAIWEDITRDHTPEEIRAHLHANTIGEIADRALDVGLQTVKAMTVLGLPGPALGAIHQSRRIRASKEFGEALAQTATLMAESKVKSRDPKAAREAADQLGTVPSVFVEPRKLTEVLAQAEKQHPGVTEQFRNTLPEVLAQVETATRDGELVEIPVADYLAHVVNTPVQTVLDPYLKASEGALSPAEAKERKAEIEKIIAGAEQAMASDIQKAETAEQKAAAKKTQQEVEQIREKIDEQLSAAKGQLADLKFTPKEQKQLSRVLSAIYASMARAMKKSPLELFAERPVQITAEGVKVETTGAEQLSQVGPSPQFYSALARAVEALPTKTATAQGWRDALKGLVNKGIVKQDEIAWSGIEDLLKMQEGKITREQVLEFLAGNGVQVQTVSMGEDRGTRFRVGARGHEAQYFDNREEAEDYADELRALEAQLDREGTRRVQVRVEEQPVPSNTKFGTYQLPGGTNYREVLLTMPEGGPVVTRLKEIQRRLGEIASLPATVHEERKAELTAEHDALQAEWRDLRGRTPETFKGSHWDVPNVLAHIRMNDRVDSEGNKVLFVEELQSDWAQKGRSQGFREEVRKTGPSEGFTVEQTDTQYKVTDPVSGRRVDIGKGTVGDEELARDYAAGYFKTQEKEAPQHGFPAAPFVTKTEGWLNLALKKVLMLAVEGGYDKVAFITGEQSAERYDLSKHVSSISYDADNEHLVASGIEDHRTVVDERVAADDLDDYVGKEVANKIREELSRIEEAMASWSIVQDDDGKFRLMRGGEEMTPRRFNTEESAQNWIDNSHLPVVRLQGLDLKVGGEGMKAFYDKIVPNAVKALSKKLGGTVQDVNIKTGNAPDDVVAKFKDNEQFQAANAAHPQPGVTLTPALRQQVQQGLPLFQRQLGAYDTRLAQIILRPGATPATVLHEMMHFYVDTLLRIPQPDGEAQQQVDALFKFWGVSREQWDKMSFEERVPLHESITYNWERYLATGEAPSTALKGLFQKILLWMRRAYESIRDIAATYRQEFGTELPPITPGLRRFFDLILANEEQVAMAEAVREQSSAFLTREQALSLGVTPEKWAEYQALRDAQHAAAVGAVTVEMLRHAKWLRAAVLKSEEAVKAELERDRARIRKQVEKDVRERRVYHAQEQLRHGTVDLGNGNTAPMKIDRDSVTTGMRWIEGNEEKLAPISKQNGLQPDLAAKMLGYETGDAMLRDIFAAPPIEEVIDRETDARLRQESVLADPAAIRDAVARAVHSELRTRVVAAEMEMLSVASKPARLTRAAAKEAASRLLARTKVSDLSPRRLLALEARAAVRARTAVSEGKTADALLALRQQLVFNELAKLAIDARKDVESSLRRFRTMLGGPDLKTAQKRSMPLVQGVRAILAAWGIGHPENPAAFLELLRQHDPQQAAEVDREITPQLARAPRVTKGPGFAAATYAAFQDMKAQVDLLWHRSEREETIATEAGRVLLDGAVTELTGQMRTVYGDPRHPGPMTKKERRTLLHRFAGAALKRTEHWVRMVDGGPDGPVHRLLWRPLRKAYDAYLAAHAEPFRALYRLLKAVEPHLGKVAIPAPEIGYTFTDTRELMGALQHAGNESNLQGLLENYGWAVRDEATGDLDTTKWHEFLKRAFKEGILRKEHTDYVQAVWNFNEQVLAPMSQKAMLDLFGVFWTPIEPTPLETPWGTLRGGYMPKKIDPTHPGNASLRADITLDSLREMETTFRESMPGSRPAGHTMQRVPVSKRALSLDLGIQLQHLDEVLRFVHLQPAIRDVANVLKHRAFSAYANGVDQTIIRSMLMPMLEATARNAITTPPVDAKFQWPHELAGALRRNVGLGFMFGSVRNALQQASGVSNANQYVQARFLGPATIYVAFNPIEAVREATARSRFMHLRIDQRLGDLRQDIEVVLDPERYGAITRFNNRFGYILQSLVQHRADVVTWHGAFAQSLEQQGATPSDEVAVAKAVDQADEAVRLAQGSQTPIDVADYERGGNVWRLVVQFSSYPNLIFNQIASARGLGPRTVATLRALVVPALIASTVTALLAPPKDFDDENGDGDTYDEYLKFFVGDQIKMAVAMVPVIGPMFGNLVTQVDRQAVDRVTPGPFWAIVSAVLRSYGTGEKAVLEGTAPNITGTTIRDLGQILTALTGVPLTPLTRAAGYLRDVEMGKVEPPSVGSAVRGIVTGR